nr:hypothetical protein [uncultured Marinifilum sp.]
MKENIDKNIHEVNKSILKFEKIKRERAPDIFTMMRGRYYENSPFEEIYITDTLKKEIESNIIVLKKCLLDDIQSSIKSDIIRICDNVAEIIFNSVIKDINYYKKSEIERNIVPCRESKLIDAPDQFVLDTLFNGGNVYEEDLNGKICVEYKEREEEYAPFRFLKEQLIVAFEIAESNELRAKIKKSIENFKKLIREEFSVYTNLLYYGNYDVELIDTLLDDSTSDNCRMRWTYHENLKTEIPSLERTIEEVDFNVLRHRYGLLSNAKSKEFYELLLKAMKNRYSRNEEIFKVRNRYRTIIKKLVIAVLILSFLLIFLFVVLV